jgi:hypothetical protein
VRDKALRIVERSRITDEHGRDIAVTRVAPRGPDELAARARRKRAALEADEADEAAAPQLRKAADFRRRLDELSSRVRRLTPPQPGRPEAFHEERWEIARALQRLAEQLR